MIDPGLATELVQRDVELALAEVFDAGDGGGFRLAEPGGNSEPITNKDVTAVAWTWTGTHTGRSALLPYQRTGRQVTVEGVTLVTEGEDGEPQFHRHVDWVGALGQIGITLTDRPVFDETDVVGMLGDLRED